MCLGAELIVDGDRVSQHLRRAWEGKSVRHVGFESQRSCRRISKPRLSEHPHNPPYRPLIDSSLTVPPLVVVSSRNAA
jgi:hypothetical protein